MAAGSWKAARWTVGEAAAVLAAAALCAVLASLVGNELAAPLAGLPPVAPRAPTETTAGSGAAARPSFALRPIEAYAEVVARPIFSSTRRPAQESAQALAASDDLVLVGIVAAADARSAIILHGQPLKAVRLAEGQSIDGWTVRSILADRVVIENAGAVREMKLLEKSARGPARR
jgi:hypothetical protein